MWRRSKLIQDSRNTVKSLQICWNRTRWWLDSQSKICLSPMILREQWLWPRRMIKRLTLHNLVSRHKNLLLKRRLEMKRGTSRSKSVFRIQRDSSLHAATLMMESSGWESLARIRERGAKFTERRWGSMKCSAWMTTQCRLTFFQIPTSPAASRLMIWYSWHSSTTTRWPIITSCGTSRRERWLEFLSSMSMESSSQISQWPE